MIPITALKDQTVALFGLGGSGIATAKAIVAGGAKIVAWDDNPDSVARAQGAGIATGDLRQADWSQFAAFVLSPGVPLTHPKPHWSVEMAHAAGVEIIGDVELFVRERNHIAPDCPFIAITGTNGKSTTTALIAHIIKASGRDMQLGGNIGTAILTLEPPAQGRFYVVECSSYQIDLAPSLNPTAGILLNLTPDHLDRHGAMENYAAIKARLVEASGMAIIGVDDTYCTDIAERLGRKGVKVTRISKDSRLENGYFADGPMLFVAKGGEAEQLASLEGIGSLRGAHNMQNALAAIAACLSVGLSIEEIRTGLSSFPGLAHRMEQVGNRGKVLFVNDSKATNAEATAPALASFPQNIYWIAGGVPKAGGIASLTDFFPRIAKAYLIGEAAAQFAATLGDAVPFEISDTLGVAVEHAARDAGNDAASEPVVLLSPACASFDQFPNFEKRGDTFRSAVLALPGTNPMRGES
ncbi:UDP-N-acetylmuramoyl-L-alanine--D-glutamate ligase [Falsochrobactrum sp. TDYN1]|uniref:UDP-N-acetylmuramoylalanine--D-glutamate ligase n=1 Tax=Falsochrobactrum tianjinense TaxID=2706015 RepID=A0A949PPP9_9HYPH|nr:UDP-N-acetylmuramoyl-L-alanine--D-glutamate ligase [Falsochrobactrum sp. TDYN1]MBV2143934.1 UDP-N-acetylmuramoyl-L-alanine--D-glutamate ligase [Falsochrobactrum sp. TDYN1]